ncbi:MAG: hypothetical protein JXA96_17145 [Sedimentisphaerales bacterium]|nr:hypothetical protein [Sedimentisphaerales bacterium]
MKNIEDNKEKLLGTRVAPEFVENFSNYCQDKGFKRNILSRFFLSLQAQGL